MSRGQMKKNEIYRQIQQRRRRAPEEEHGHLRRAEKRTHQRKERAFYNEEMRELESARREKAVRLLYQKLNSTRENSTPRTSKEGRLMSDKEGVLRRWREHFDGILNKETIPPSEPSPTQGVSAESRVVSELTMEEVQKALHKMKNNKSPGIDTIPSELIKFGGESLMKRIHELIRRVRAHEKIPDEWKRSITCPIHKKRDLLECANYRGISLLNIAYKVLSNIIYARLFPHTEPNTGSY
jgi:hypothetical protein